MKIDLDLFATRAGKVLFCVLFLGGCMLSVAAVRGSIFLLFVAVFAGFLAALLFVRIWLPEISRNLVNGLLLPKRFLKQAPPKMGPVYCAIEEHRYEDAKRELLSLLNTAPFDPELTDAMLTLYADHLNQPDQAKRFVSIYFQRDRYCGSEKNIRILMRYSDLCMQSGEYAEIAQVLQKELNSPYYSEPDKKSVGIRLSAVQRLLSGE